MSSITRHPKFPTGKTPKGQVQSAARIPRPRDSVESGDFAASRAQVASRSRAARSEFFAYAVIFAILFAALTAVVLAGF